MNEIAQAVKQRRGKMTLRQAAVESEVSPATLLRVEAGRDPDLKVFIKLCRWLNISPSELLGVKPFRKTRGERPGNDWSLSACTPAGHSVQIRNTNPQCVVDTFHIAPFLYIEMLDEGLFSVHFNGHLWDVEFSKGEWVTRDMGKE